ncbi:MAG TPA: PH domain-containing protein [Patescibacteria group bacterium]|uniref:DUF304 domain-containing protein n=1 Tax=Candidatus Woesebacteria bacterium RBG_13_46_13 TaxID=1802479 RepID=A0A1F7X4Y0_9BACT|nr:MAG: hypothetical protein A2Y68_01810 [Candidatus Woesebacteria bacterium RBG_13_46_13]HJX59318.1 PH domain-containing protein [Patescibacteria group bacterium]
MPDIFITDSEEKDSPAPTPSVFPEPKTATQRERLTGHTHNPLASYSYFPDNVTFENREKEEKIILLLRRHPVTNLTWIMVGALMLLAPVILTVFPFLSFLPARFQFVAVLGWYMVSFAFVLEKFVVWYYDIFIITNERVLDIDFYNLIYKEVTDASLDKIQDVTYSVGGVGRAIFNYGDVLIQTAAELENLRFQAIPWPDKVAKILQDIRMEEKKAKD